MIEMEKNVLAFEITKGKLIGISVCPKCNIINKIRSSATFVESNLTCVSCGSKITIDKHLK